MEISDFIFGIILIYFLIVTMLIIGAISKYKFKKENESNKKIIKFIDQAILGIAVGILTSSLAVIYYNWVNCAYVSECQFLKTPNFYNIYFPMAFASLIIIIGIWVFLVISRIILTQKKI